MIVNRINCDDPPPETISNDGELEPPSPKLNVTKLISGDDEWTINTRRRDLDGKRSLHRVRLQKVADLRATTWWNWTRCRGGANKILVHGDDRARRRRRPAGFRTHRSLSVIFVIIKMDVFEYFY